MSFLLKNVIFEKKLHQRFKGQTTFYVKGRGTIYIQQLCPPSFLRLYTNSIFKVYS